MSGNVAGSIHPGDHTTLFCVACGSKVQCKDLWSDREEGQWICPTCFKKPDPLLKAGNRWRNLRRARYWNR